MNASGSRPGSAPPTAHPQVLGELVRELDSAAPDELAAWPSPPSGAGVGLPAAVANRHVVEQFPGARFVTALMMEVDVPDGTLPAAEFVRGLTHAVVDHVDGELADDATAACLNWHRPPGAPAGGA